VLSAETLLEEAWREPVGYPRRPRVEARHPSPGARSSAEVERLRTNTFEVRGGGSGYPLIASLRRGPQPSA
jgi:hypothetical protein